MKKISKNLLKLSILSLILVFSFGLNLEKESKLLASNNFNVSEIDLEVYDNFYMDGLILFDSNIQHCVPANQNHKKRISIAFNIYSLPFNEKKYLSEP